MKLEQPRVLPRDQSTWDDATRHALAGMGGQVEVRFRVGFSPLSQSDLRVFGPFEVLVGTDLERPS